MFGLSRSYFLPVRSSFFIQEMNILISLFQIANMSFIILDLNIRFEIEFFISEVTIKKHNFRFEIQSEEPFVKQYYMHIKQTIEFFLLFLQYTVDFKLGSVEKNIPVKT